MIGSLSFLFSEIPDLYLRIFEQDYSRLIMLYSAHLKQFVFKLAGLAIA